MTIIINEFEVVPENAPTHEESAPAAPTAAAGVSAPDVERLIEYLDERALRVWAH